MDSENEVIIVDDIIATNGLNGHSEDLSEMKTRSKTSEVDALKAKVRNSVRSVGGQDKAGSDTEKKDKKVESKPTTKDAPATKVTSQDKQSSNSNASSAVKKSSSKSNEEQLPAQLLSSSKKRNLEREDDSGINSRASSVSNDDATPRMRTRSSRSSDIASTSTPAKKGQGRMPLSTYDFEDITFEDDISSSSSSLKRKAVLYVEEMEDADEEKEAGSEPAAKRPALKATTNFFNAVLSPIRALRGKLAARSQRATAEKVTTPVTEEQTNTNVPKTDVEDISKENASQPATSQPIEASTNAPETCRIM